MFGLYKPTFDVNKHALQKLCIHALRFNCKLEASKIKICCYLNVNFPELFYVWFSLKPALLYFMYKNCQINIFYLSSLQNHTLQQQKAYISIGKYMTCREDHNNVLIFMRTTRTTLQSKL